MNTLRTNVGDHLKSHRKTCCHGGCVRSFFSAAIRRGGLVLLSVILVLGHPTLRAAEKMQNFADLSLEQLLNETVTSVSKREQRRGDAAAAISVLSHDDLQRSGATTLPEALRWVPGLNVSAYNASQWAISSRGFNGIYANKLLVLVDGRAVYTPLFAGVYWDLQQTMLADLDRIEVIRGPGASVWGANAVNGVINVVSLSARETQGGLIYGGGGTVREAFGGARYGTQISSNTFLRVFGAYQRTDDYVALGGARADDRWWSGHGGFRLDHYPDEDSQATWQGDFTFADLDNHVSDAFNVNLIGRWKQTLSDRSNYEIQTYMDRTCRDEMLRAHSEVDTMDLTFQHTFGWSEHNDVVWGLGYRYINNELKATTPLVSVLDRAFDLHLGSAFVQNDWHAIPDKFTLTVGTKLEHNDFTGWEVQPTVRATFKPTERQTLWAAISRAVRTPSEVEAMNLIAFPYGSPIVGPGGFNYVPTIFGNPQLDAEKLWAYEIGCRFQPTSRLNVEVNAFYNDYDDVGSVGAITQFIPGAPGVAVMPFGNYEYGYSWGGELTITFAATDKWRLIGGYSLLVTHNYSIVPMTDPQWAEDGAPRNQITLRSAYDFSSHWSLDIQARYVDAIRSVPSYITADVQLRYRPTSNLELSLVGQNLFDRSHLEYRPDPLAVVAEVPRGFFGRLTWKF